jgi:hypothetical protein
MSLKNLHIHKTTNHRENGSARGLQTPPSISAVSDLPVKAEFDHPPVSCIIPAVTDFSNGTSIHDFE